MSMLNNVQTLIAKVSHSVKSNGLDAGLSAHEIDEITQIISLIKRIISDGIQRSDIHKIITLLGEMMELMPEFEAEIKAVIKGLKALYKRLFDSDMVTHDSPLKQVTQVEASLSTTQDIGEKGMLSDVEIINQLTPQSKRPDEVLVDQIILNETLMDRLTIAEEILTIVNNHLVLSEPNIEGMTKFLSGLKLRKNMNGND